MTMDNKEINKEELKDVSGGGEPIVVDLEAHLKCPNCKSFNYAPVYSERILKFNKVTFRCADCQHKWVSLIEIED